MYVYFINQRECNSTSIDLHGRYYYYDYKIGYSLNYRLIIF